MKMNFESMVIFCWKQWHKSQIDARYIEIQFEEVDRRVIFAKEQHESLSKEM